MFNIIEKNIFCKMDEDGRSKWKDIKKDFFKLLPYYGCNLNSFHEKYPLLKQRWNRIENNHFLEKDMFEKTNNQKAHTEKMLLQSSWRYLRAEISHGDPIRRKYYF